MLLCDGPLSPVFPSSLTRLYRIQYVATSISSCGNHTISAWCLVKNVPPSSRCIIHTKCRFLQSCSNFWWMTCFWWQLAHNITIHIIRLSLKKGCFEINVEKIPTFVGCHLATHAKSRSGGSRRVCLQVILLFVLEFSQYPSRLCPEEVALLVGFNQKPHCQSRISTRCVSLQQAACSILALPGLTLLFVHEIAFGSCSCGFSTGCHATFQHVSGLIVNSVWEFNSCSAGIVGHFLEAQ